MTNKGICFACGKEYDICPHCPGESTGFIAWRRMHCCMNHFKLFELAREYRNGKYTKDEALQMLEQIDHSGYEHWQTGTGRFIREILSAEPSSPTGHEGAAEAPIADEESAEKSAVQTKRSRRAKTKNNDEYFTGI